MKRKLAVAAGVTMFIVYVLKLRRRKTIAELKKMEKKAHIVKRYNKNTRTHGH